jgi:23S rRNA (adenine2030-N6)-methyltransferase
MLSYQHAYHAGNPADVHKHTVLAAVLAQLTQKPAPLHYAETHAGRGLYPVSGGEMQKLREYATGLAKLPWGAPPTALSSPYLAAVQRFNTVAEGLTTVPGSPAVAVNALRPQDLLHLCEAHPQEFTHLQTAFQGALARPNVHLHQADGPTRIAKLIRPGQRWLVCVDPSYERKTDYADTAAQVQALLAVAPQACVLVWYPRLANSPHTALVQGLMAGAGVPSLWHSSWRWPAPKSGKMGMIGSGMLAINLPFPLGAGNEPALPTLLEATAHVLGATAKATWLQGRA